LKKKETIPSSCSIEADSKSETNRDEDGFTGKEKWVQRCSDILDRLWDTGKLAALLLAMAAVVYFVFVTVRKNLSTSNSVVAEVGRGSPVSPKPETSSNTVGQLKSDTTQPATVNAETVITAVQQVRSVEKPENKVPVYVTRLSDNAFDSVMLFCRKHKLPLSIDPEAVQLLGKAQVDLPDNPTDPIQALSKGVATRGFVIQQVSLTPNKKVAFLTTPDCWVYLNAVQCLGQGNLVDAQRWLQGFKPRRASEYSQHCAELSSVLEAVALRNHEISRFEADMKKAVEVYRQADTATAVARTAAASALSAGTAKSQLAIAKARAEDAFRACSQVRAVCMEFIRGEILKNKTIVNRWATAFDQSLTTESQVLLENIFDSYSKLKALQGVFEQAGISFSENRVQSTSRSRTSSRQARSSRKEEVPQEEESSQQRIVLSPNVDLGNPPDDLLQLRDKQGKLLIRAAQYCLSGIAADEIDRFKATRDFSRSHIIDKSSLTARVGYGYCIRDAYVQSLGFIDRTTRQTQAELEAVIGQREEAEKLRMFYLATKRPVHVFASKAFAPIGHVRGLAVNGFSEGSLLAASANVIPLKTKTVTVTSRRTDAAVIGNERGYFGGFSEKTLVIQSEVQDAPIHINAVAYGDQVDPWMRISAYEAYKWLRTIEPGLGDTQALDITLHNLGGPKGGDSAGVTFATCGYSAVKSIPVRASVAMTGSVRADGAVKAVGGVPQKIAGAIQANGVEIVIVPKENEPDLLFIPVEQLLRLTLIVADRMDTYLNYAMNWPANDMTKEQLEAQKTLAQVQLAQVLLSLGDQAGAKSLLKPVAANHPEVYTARRLLDLLNKSNARGSTSMVRFLTDKETDDIIMALPYK